MHVLIIGGNGFIGRNLTRYFTNAGDKVTVIGRSVSYEPVAGESFYSIQETGLNLIAGYLNQSDDYVVIDLAYTSVPNTSFDDPVKDFSENLYNVIRHLEFAKRIPVAKYIYISSGGTVYGNVASSPINEDCSNFPLSPYGITKMACERYVNLYHQVHGLNTGIVRPANIYGPGQKPFRGQGFVSTALGLAYKGEPAHVFGDGTHERDYLFIDDFCDGLNDIIKHGQSGHIYNLGSAQGVSTNQVVARINDLLHNEQIMLEVQHYPNRPFDVRSNVLDYSKVNALNGWRPKTTFNDGIAITQKWIREYMAANHL